MSPRIIQLVAVLIAVVLVIGSATFTPRINDGRREMNMYGAESPMENIPPEYAFAIQAFGAFRSIITDIVFIRAEKYKEQGRYFDALQLHQWICKLQPRFPTVWEYCSWNMAWNISVTTYTPEERWNWVYNGARLIRDEGLEYNPRAVNLYKQLAWIFNNKMGENVDDYHMTYKRNWAWRMHLLLGPPPDPLGKYDPASVGDIQPGDDALKGAVEGIHEQRVESGSIDEQEQKWFEQKLRESADGDGSGLTPYEIVKRAAYDRIKAIADAPRTLEELYAKYPETRAMVEKLRALDIDINDDELSEDEYWREGGLAHRFFMRYRELTDAPSIMARILRGEPNDTDAGSREQMGKVLGLADNDAAGRALVRFVQRKVLSEVYKLDPGHMTFLVQRFGPMDWRAVDSQALYWVTMGIIRGGETLDNFSNDKTNTTRIMFFCLRNLYLRGRITFEPFPPALDASYINFEPDPNFIESLHRAYLDYGAYIDPDPGRGSAGETFRSGHINFLTEGIRLLWFSGREAEAAKYYEFLRDHYGRHDDGRMKDEYAVPLEDFVFGTFGETFDTHREVVNFVSGLIVTAYGELAAGNVPRFNRLMKRAREARDNYMKDKTDFATDRMSLPPFDDIMVDILRSLLSQPSLNHLGTIEKVRLWTYLQVHLKQAVYDDLIAGLTAECEQWNFDAARAFPEPPGMAAYREQNKGRGREADERDIETPAQPLGGG